MFIRKKGQVREGESMFAWRNSFSSSDLLLDEGVQGGEIFLKIFVYPDKFRFELLDELGGQS